MPRQIGYVIGSLRKESINRKLANALIKLAPPDFTFKELRIGDLPLYNQDDDKAQAPEVQRLKSELRAVDAVMFVTAEYNRSIPGVLKNALDHASRPYGQSAWAGKPAGIIGASIGADRHGRGAICTCAPSWRISTCRRSGSPRPTCRSRTVSSTKPATSPMPKRESSCTAGWTSTSPGSRGSPA